MNDTHFMFYPDGPARRLVIFGAGGFGTEAVWLAEEMNAAAVQAGRGAVWEILGYLDDNPSKRSAQLYGYLVLGTPAEAASQLGNAVFFHCALGKNPVREKAAQRLESLGWNAATLIHPSVIIARGVSIGEGSYVGAGCILCPEATIGRHVLINTHVAVGHHTVLADFSQACPGARINGYCQLGRLAFIGSNASLMPGVKVGYRASVGANAQVVRSVEPLVTVAGVPARIICRPAKNESPA